MRRQKGFTLLELAIVVVVLGVVFLMVHPMLSAMLGTQKRALIEKNTWINQKIGDSLLFHAKTNTALGKLPTLTTAPYSTNFAIFNPTGTGTADENLFLQVLTQSGIDLTAINTDGYTAGRMRKLQKVSGLTATMPLYFQSGPLVTLTYEMAAIYNTVCRSNTDTGCDSYGRGTVALTSGNYTTWNISTADTDESSLVTVTTLPLQKQMLGETTRRLNRIRDGLAAYFRSKQLTAAPNDSTNWYADPNLIGASATQVDVADGACAVGTPCCRSGWYDLSQTGANPVNVLDVIGIGKTEYGKTAWGGRVDYCSDFVIDNSAANTPPHNGALRILKSASTGSNPDMVDANYNNNLFLSF